MRSSFATAIIVISICTPLVITGCSDSDVNTARNRAENSAVYATSKQNNTSKENNYTYAEDSNNDGKYDKFDSDGDGITDLTYSFDSDDNIDTETGYVPEFSLISIDGKTYDNAFLMKNELNVVIIWGYWCPDCLYELYHLTNYYETEDSEEAVNIFNQLSDKVGVFGISIGSDTVNTDDIDRFETVVREYCDIYDIPFDNILNTAEASDLLNSIRTYKTENRDYSSTVPAVALIDPQGNIIEVIYEGSADQIVKEIEDNL